jgi:hypothetical protein
MTRLLIGNEFDEDLRGAERESIAWWVQRLAWFARDHDVLVLPEAPGEGYLEYVAELTGTRRETLSVVVPPPGRTGTRILTADRILGPALLDMLKSALAGREIDEIIPLWPHSSIATLATRLDAGPALPGHGFISQGGGSIVGSKAIFRAVSAGVGVPLPAGAVCSNVLTAEEVITRLIEKGETAILKLEYRSGGTGNEVLSPTEGVRPVGARRTVVVKDRGAVRAYLEEQWDWLTDHETHRIVIENYVRDSRAYYSELLISDDAVELSGTGELMAAPQHIGSVTPSGLDPDLEEEVIEGGRLMCEALRAMGYRGWVGADAIVTPDRRVMFTEWNGRFTGTTHTHHILGEVVVGPGYAKDRILLQRLWPPGWPTPPFRALLDALAAAGLAYDPATRAGVIIDGPPDSQRQGAMYSIVAPDIDSAWDVDQEVGDLFFPS